MENIKNSKGEVLSQPYLDLARMRREQNPNNVFPLGFASGMTREGLSFWNKVYYCNTPEIPAASLAELGEWQKAKGIAELQPAEPDWKAMYEDLKAEYERLKTDYDTAITEANEMSVELRELGAKYDELKYGDPTRNWVAECAMAAMQGMLSSPTNYKEIEHPISGKILINPQPEEIAKLSFDYAESMAAEGRKRGHLPKIEKS